MSPRYELATLLRSIQPDDVVPDDLMVERIVSLVGTDRVLAVFTLDLVNSLIVEHEDTHGSGVFECDRCSSLEDIVRDLESAR